MAKKPQYEANRLVKLSPQTRSGIVRGLQLVSETFDLDESEKQTLQECINIVSGVSVYREDKDKTEELPEKDRPDEIKEADKLQPEEEPKEEKKDDKKESRLPRRTNPAKPSRKYIDPRRFLR